MVLLIVKWDSELTVFVEKCVLVFNSKKYQISTLFMYFISRQSSVHFFSIILNFIWIFLKYNKPKLIIINYHALSHINFGNLPRCHILWPNSQYRHNWTNHRFLLLSERLYCRTVHVRFEIETPVKLSSVCDLYKHCIHQNRYCSICLASVCCYIKVICFLCEGKI